MVAEELNTEKHVSLKRQVELLGLEGKQILESRETMYVYRFGL